MQELKNKDIEIKALKDDLFSLKEHIQKTVLESNEVLIRSLSSEALKRQSRQQVQWSMD